MTTIITEDGSNVPNSNSYVSISEADDYISMNPHYSDAWAALAPQEKGNLLIYATRTLDALARWLGRKTYPDSALRWPRRDMMDADGVPVPPDVIPRAIRQAVTEMAVALLREDVPGLDTSQQIAELRVDVAEITFDTARPRQKYGDTLRALVRPYGSLAPLRFVPIRR